MSTGACQSDELHPVPLKKLWVAEKLDRSRAVIDFSHRRSGHPARNVRDRRGNNVTQLLPLPDRIPRCGRPGLGGTCGSDGLIVVAGGWRRTSGLRARNGTSRSYRRFRRRGHPVYNPLRDIQPGLPLAEHPLRRGRHRVQRHPHRPLRHRRCLRRRHHSRRGWSRHRGRSSRRRVPRLPTVGGGRRGRRGADGRGGGDQGTHRGGGRTATHAWYGCS